MKSTFTLSAKGWVAVVLVACVLEAFAVSTGQFLVAIVAFSTAGIAAFDSTHIHLRRYKTWLSYGPIGLFVVCALFWPFAIIWYFVVRVRIARGTMPLRHDFRPHNAASFNKPDAANPAIASGLQSVRWWRGVADHSSKYGHSKTRGRHCS